MQSIEHKTNTPPNLETIIYHKQPLDSAEQMMGLLESEADPNGQLDAAVRIAFGARSINRQASVEGREAESVALVEDLIRFSSADDDKTPLLTRSIAFEAALRLVAENGYADKPDVPELIAYRQRLEELMPEYFQTNIFNEVNFDYHGYPPHKQSVYSTANHLVKIDNLQRNLVFLDVDYGHDPDLHKDMLPVGLHTLGDIVIDRERPSFGVIDVQSRDDITRSVLRSVGRVLEGPLSAEELRQAYIQEHSQEALLKARISRIYTDADDTKEQEILALPRDEVVYPEAFDAAYEAIDTIGNVFPESYTSSIGFGARMLLAESMEAVLEHERNGRNTHDTIPLLNGNELPVTLSDNEPYELLTKLTDAAQLLNDSFASDTVRSVLAVDGQGFKIWRLIDLTHKLPPAVSIQLRAYGARGYDPLYEYGRPQEGVEATLSFVIDPTVTDGIAPPIKIGKKPYTNGEIDNRISIRLDREGREEDVDEPRDPTRQKGVVSLDVGSVLGDDRALGTRIGRFLAWGNKLASQKTDKESGLNHRKVTMNYYDPKRPQGDADVFAVMVHQFDERLQTMQATPAELKAFAADYQGKLAVDKLVSVETPAIQHAAA